jgi:hypothetical protein
MRPRRLTPLLLSLLVVMACAFAPAAQADFITTDGGQYANATVDPTADDSAADDAAADDDAYNDDENVSGYEDGDDNSADDEAVVTAATPKAKAKTKAKHVKKAKKARRGRGKAKVKKKSKATAKRSSARR